MTHEPDRLGLLHIAAGKRIQFLIAETFSHVESRILVRVGFKTAPQAMKPGL